MLLFFLNSCISIKIQSSLFKLPFSFLFSFIFVIIMSSYLRHTTLHPIVAAYDASVPHTAPSGSDAASVAKLIRNINVPLTAKLEALASSRERITVNAHSFDGGALVATFEYTSNRKFKSAWVHLRYTGSRTVSQDMSVQVPTQHSAHLPASQLAADALASAGNALITRLNG